MADAPLVVLVGSSLLMDGVAITLAKSGVPALERVDFECGDVQERLQALRPDLIVFDLDHPFVQSMRSLLRSKSELLLIGLDMENCLAIAMTSRQHITHSMNDLCRLIQDRIHPVLRPEKEGQRLTEMK